MSGWSTTGVRSSYAEDVYEKIFHRNAEAFFPGAAPKSDERPYAGRKRTRGKTPADRRIRQRDARPVSRRWSSTFSPIAACHGRTPRSAPKSRCGRRRTARTRTASCICRSIREACSTAPSRAIRQSRLRSALPCSVVMDADHALGLVASRRAIDLAIEIATTHGVGAVAVRNSSHFGAAGYYADHAAAQGLIGLAFTNASPAIAPTGGTEGLFGTNPIGVGHSRCAMPTRSLPTWRPPWWRARASGTCSPPGKRPSPKAGRSIRAAGRRPIPPKRSKARYCRSAVRRVTRCR